MSCLKWNISGMAGSRRIESTPTSTYFVPFKSQKTQLTNSHEHEAGHPDARLFTGNSDAMDILTLGLGRVLGLELGRQDVIGLKNTGVNLKVKKHN